MQYNFLYLSRQVFWLSMIIAHDLDPFNIFHLWYISDALMIHTWYINDAFIRNVSENDSIEALETLLNGILLPAFAQFSKDSKIIVWLRVKVCLHFMSTYLRVQLIVLKLSSHKDFVSYRVKQMQPCSPVFIWAWKIVLVISRLSQWKVVFCAL